MDADGVVVDAAVAESGVSSADGVMAPPPTCLGPFISISLSQSDSGSSFLSSLLSLAGTADVIVDGEVF